MSTCAPHLRSSNPVYADRAVWRAGIAGVPGAGRRLVVVLTVSAQGVLGEEVCRAVVRRGDPLPETNARLVWLLSAGDGLLDGELLA